MGVSAVAALAGAERVWWRDGVIYQCYPRSFADANGDGIGDIRGVIDRLDYLQWLGVDALWLNPTYPSPNADWGYDVADYLDVHPELGDLADVDELIAKAAARGIRIVMDLVPNHTSDQHRWFQAARAARDSPFRDFYIWSDPVDGGPPNNWVSMFGGSAWTFDEPTGQYYMHNFLPTQPDLNWWNPAVREAFDDIMRFWLERGVAGFRIDVAHGIVKDKALRDNPPSQDGDRESWKLRGQRAIYSMNRPEVHELHKHWRRVMDDRDPPAVLIGETLVHDLEALAEFYGDGEDELHLAFNFIFAMAECDVERLKAIVRRTEELLPEPAWPAWLLSNHDLVRFPTRWGDENVDKVRCLLLLLLTLRGTAVLYYGDELGMGQVDVPPERRRDPRPIGRDGARTPMPWHAGHGAGFTFAGTKPWLPVGEARTLNLADQQAQPDSTLRLSRDLIALRRTRPDLARGRYEELPSAAGVWVFRRGEGTCVAVNLGQGPVTVPLRHERVLLSTPRGREGEGAGARLELAPRSAVVVAASRR